jgi:hypothetical protein
MVSDGLSGACLLNRARVLALNTCRFGVRLPKFIIERGQFRGLVCRQYRPLTVTLSAKTASFGLQRRLLGGKPILDRLHDRRGKTRWLGALHAL